MEKIKEIVRKGLCGGAIIGFGGVAFLLSPDKIIGAILFAIGLVSVIIFQANLFTGKIGYITKDSENIRNLWLMLLLNIAGASVVGLIFSPLCHEAAAALISQKFQINLINAFIKSIGCGVSIQLAVSLFKRTNNIVTIILPVVTFILCGFEHCIANTFYYASALDIISINIFSKYFIIYVIGNSIGAIITRISIGE